MSHGQTDTQTDIPSPWAPVGAKNHVVLQNGDKVVLSSALQEERADDELDVRPNLSPGQGGRNRPQGGRLHEQYCHGGLHQTLCQHLQVDKASMFNPNPSD